MVQLPWEKLRQFLKKLELEGPYDPAGLLPVVYLKYLKQDLEEMSALSCLLQHYSQ